VGSDQPARPPSPAIWLGLGLLAVVALAAVIVAVIVK
jgi:MYXO-CTERM domain-containing protein